jgi:antirestriction protein ArdC
MAWKNTRQSTRSTDEPTKGQQNAAKVDAWLDQLAAETDAARASDQMKAYLSTMARFHRYSWGNQLLIMMQRPDASRVASYKKWLELGRQVKKGEKGISILVPYSRKDEESGERRVTGFGGGTVFDVSQTEGPELPTIGYGQGVDGDHTALYDRLVAAAQGHGITVMREDMAESTYGYSQGGKIALNTRQSSSDLVPVLIHEIAHEVLHQVVGGREGTTKQSREVQAEATAYAVCAGLGIPYADSGVYLALYGADRAAIKASLDAIKRGVSTIMGWLESEPEGTDEQEGAAA